MRRRLRWGPPTPPRLFVPPSSVQRGVGVSSLWLSGDCRPRRTEATAHMRIADASAWEYARSDRAPNAVRAAFDAALIGGEIATCDLVKLEVLKWTTRDNFEVLCTALDALPSVAI